MFASHCLRSVRSSALLLAKRNYAVGQNIAACSDVKLRDVTGDEVALDRIFGNKRVVLFGVPGAFTPTCTNAHVPAYLERYNELKAAGADNVACVAVNDYRVMSAWSDRVNADGLIDMYADVDGFFTNLLGLELDLSAAGLGPRSKRYSIVVDSGQILFENVEEAAGELTVSAPEQAIAQLGLNSTAGLYADMAGSAEAGDVSRCLRLFHHLYYIGVQPSVQAYLHVMNAYLVDGDKSGIEAFHERLLNDGVSLSGSEQKSVQDVLSAAQQM